MNYITNTKSKLKWKYNKVDKSYNVNITQLSDSIIHKFDNNSTNITDVSSNLVVDKTGRYGVQFLYDVSTGNIDAVCNCI